MKLQSVGNESQKLRQLSTVVSGVATSDGAGVKLTRIIGSRKLDMLDPFLLLDCFESDNPDDYIAGFPTHPHRGFETVTYLLDGQMRHKDSKGNEGVIAPGGVQWMTAGKGILHSEMPEQKDGLLKGFQLWINLPKSAKMTEPAYQEFPADKVVLEKREDGTQVRVIAGTTSLGSTGPVINEYTYPIYMDVILPSSISFNQEIADQHNAFVYVVEGELLIEDQSITTGNLGVLVEGDAVQIKASKNSRFLLIAGKPMNEPVARHGPFVMNTQAELREAFNDYQLGKF